MDSTNANNNALANQEKFGENIVLLNVNNNTMPSTQINVQPMRKLETVSIVVFFYSAKSKNIETLFFNTFNPNFGILMMMPIAKCFWFRHCFPRIIGELRCWKLATVLLSCTCLCLLLILIAMTLAWRAFASDANNRMEANYSELKQMIKNDTTDILRTQENIIRVRDDRDNFWNPLSLPSAVKLTNHGRTLEIKFDSNYRGTPSYIHFIEAYWPFNITAGGPKIVHYFEVKIVRNNYWPRSADHSSQADGGTVAIGLGNVPGYYYVPRHYYMSSGYFFVEHDNDTVPPGFEKEGSIVGCGMLPLMTADYKDQNGYQIFFTKNGELLEQRYALNFAAEMRYQNIVPNIVFLAGASLEMEMEVNFGDRFAFEFYKLWFKEDKVNNGSMVFPYAH